MDGYNHVISQSLLPDMEGYNHVISQSLLLLLPSDGGAPAAVTDGDGWSAADCCREDASIGAP